MALASSGILPMIHVAVRDGPELLARFPLSNLSATCGCYALGTVFYVLRVPEKQIPKIFDVWVSLSLLFFPLLICPVPYHQGENWKIGHKQKWLTMGVHSQGASHQIFHILVAFGQIIHLLGLKRVMLMQYS